jgi:hypothetical protein
MEPSGSSDTIAVVALLVSVAGLLIAVLSARSAQRSAIAAERSADSSDRSATAAEDSAVSSRRAATAAEAAAVEQRRQADATEASLRDARDARQSDERAAAVRAAVARVEGILDKLATLETEVEDAGANRPGRAERARERGRRLVQTEWVEAIESPLLSPAERTRLMHLRHARAPTFFRVE